MKKILIIEDEKVLAKAEQEEFRSMGYEVKIVQNGDEALETVAIFEPHLIVLDLILPKKGDSAIGGLAVLRELKTNPEFKNIPVVVSTNLADDKTEKEAIDMGAAAYLIKTQSSIYDIGQAAKKYLKDRVK